MESTFSVQGMTCSHCVRAVSAEVAKIDGVNKVEVNLERGTVTVESAVPLDRDTVAMAVDEAGYELVGEIR